MSTVSPDVEQLDAEGVIAAAADRAPRLALACSFQKEESVLLHLLRRAAPEATVFALDTGVLPPETHETWARFEEFFGITIERRRGTGPEALWETDPDRCCALRKVVPLKAALSELDGWVTGVRRDQSPTRAGTPKLGWDEGNGLWKASPLADWSDRDVWGHIAAHGLPYHPLHDRGYASIGCTPCTRPGEGRAGRWTGQAKIECGLHPAR